jgi:hypothetical protein
VAAFAFVSHGEAAEAEEPGYGPLDLPPVPFQAFGRLDARTCDPRGDAAPAQPGQGFGGMVSLVRPAGSPCCQPGERRRRDQVLQVGAGSYLLDKRVTTAKPKSSWTKPPPAETSTRELSGASNWPGCTPPWPTSRQLP